MVHGNRKFIVVLVIVALAFVALLLGKVGADNFERIVLGVGLMFIGGDVTQKYIERKRESQP